MDKGAYYGVEPGACYLIEEKKPDIAYRFFKELTCDGLPALVITRQHPAVVRRMRGVTSRVIWLCHMLGKDVCNPTALRALYEEITTFVSESLGKTVTLLDGLDYLTVHNEFRRTLMFVEDMNEFVDQHESIVLITVNPDAFPETDLARLEGELEVRDSPDIKTELDTREVARLLESY